MPNKNPIKISQVMVVQPPRRETIDVQNYTRALRTADRGKRRQLYDVYDNIVKDPVIGESIRKRVRHITNGGLQFMRDNETVDDMDELIETPNFRKLLDNILRTRFFGKSVFELDFSPVFSAELLERRNYDTAKKIVLKNYFDDNGWPYEGDDFLLNVGDDKELGLLMEIAPYAIFKRNGGADYAEFCELWGIPILKALYDPDDDNAREEMEETMQKRGAGGSIVASKNSEIDSVNAKVTGGVHGDFLHWLDEQILVAIIGQTMTTKDGSSHSQGKVHAEVEDDINEDDQRYILEVLNDQLLPRLEKRGYPVKGGRFMYPERDNLSLKEKIDIAERVDDRTENGVDDDYWFELTGIPRGKRKGALKQVQDDNEGRDGDEDPAGFQNLSGLKDDGSGKAINAKDHSFLQRLKDFFGDAPR